MPEQSHESSVMVLYRAEPIAQVHEQASMVLFKAQPITQSHQQDLMVLFQSSSTRTTTREHSVMVLFNAQIIVEATLDRLAGRPQQFYLIHDSLAVGSSVVSSAASEFGPRVAPAQPGVNNAGSIVPSIFGNAAGQDLDLEFQIVKGGGIGSAEWSFRGQNQVWYGQNDGFYFWGHHTPKGTGPNPGGAIVYSSQFERLVLLTSNGGAPGTGNIEIRQIGVDARPQYNTEWNVLGSSTFQPIEGIHETDPHTLATCELRDGSLLLAIRNVQRGLANSLPDLGDVDIYRSIDGGTTWNRIASEVLRNAVGGTIPKSNVGMMRIAASGDWIRLVFVANTFDISSIVSADGGATWKLVGPTLVNNVTIEQGLSTNDQDEQPFALMSLDDNAGTFLIAYRGGPAQNAIQWSVAARDDNWSVSDLGTVAPGGAAIRSMGGYVDAQYVWLWCNAFENGTANDRWYALRARRDQALDPASWIPISNVANLFGASRYSQFGQQLIWTGDRGIWLYYIEDSEGLYAIPDNRPFISYFAGWSGAPFARDATAIDLSMEQLHWNYHTGTPAGGGVTSSAFGTANGWASDTTPGGSITWTVQGVEMIGTTAANQRAAISWASVPGAGTPNQWDPDANVVQGAKIQERWLLEWVLAVGATLSSTQVGVAMRVIMPSIQTAGNAWELEVRHAADRIILHDVLAGVDRISAVGLTLAGSYEEDRYIRCRLAVQPDTLAPSFNIAMRDERGGEWIWAPDNITIGSAVRATTSMEFKFGIPGLTGPQDLYSRWRELHVSSDFQRTAYGVAFVPPVNFAGALASLVPYRLGTGSTSSTTGGYRVAWSGGSGVVGDSFTWEQQHSHPIEHVFLDSPQYPYYSAVGATAGITAVFDAQGANGTQNPGGRWNHTGAALFDPGGAESIALDYADDVNFSVQATGVVLSMIQHAGLTLQSTSGNVISFLNTTVAATPIREGALVGRYLKVTTANGGTPRAGHVHKVLRHWKENTTHYLEMSRAGQFDPSLMLAGDTVSVLSDRYFHRWTDQSAVGKRFMRVTFGTTGQNNWDGRWKLARLVVGMAKQFDPPLQWQFSDIQIPDVSEVRGRSGASWAYENAPPGRRITGSWPGDIYGAHSTFRDAINHLAGYRVQPIALMLNGEDAHGIEDTMLLTRFDGSVGLDRQAWRYDETHGEVLRPVGDMQVFFREIV